MLGDTLVIGGETLPKIKEQDYGAVYSFYRANGLSKIVATVRHSNVNGNNDNPVKDRHNIEIVETTFATSTVPEFTRKDYVVMERKPGDLSIVTIDNLADWLIAGANANLIKVMGWES